MSDSKKTPQKDSPAKGSKEEKKEDAKESQSKGAPVVDLGFLEADDDFDEFPAEEWKVEAGDVAEEDMERVNIWEDNWDDDNIEEDFSKQLKAELEKRKLTPKATVR